eukprot:15035613-Alexandrium_andersonii.AAC.1
MAGRKLPTELSLSSWAAAAPRTRDGSAAALTVVGPIVAVLVAHFDHRRLALAGGHLLELYDAAC